MKRAGFTMIELIFVIVILGILAAVALPKFIGVSEQAHEGKLKAFVGTLNRTVGPALWSKSISLGANGAVNTATYNTDLLNQITPTDEFNTTGSSFTGLTGCAADANTTIGSGVGIIGTAVLGSTTYTVNCINGSTTTSPTFYLYSGTTQLVKP